MEVNKIFIKSKLLFLDQTNRVRLLKDTHYELLKEYEDSFEIIDETDKVVIMGKENFYKLEEE